MVKASRLNGNEFYINPDLIEFIEKTPDTVLTMTTGKKVVVEESVDELCGRILDYRRSLVSGTPRLEKEEIETEKGI